ncbi:MAG TPA: ATP-binding protein [Burkholderiales bacterium]|jgi:signal transduction histidine kinase|nr:ATP-binding protein [Burkholderiales bacterium]
MAVEINRGSPLSRFIASLRQEHWLALMLLALHGSLALELADLLAQALLISHFGLFLLWQPLWHGEHRLVGRQVALILVGGALLVAARSWWLMALWLAVLFSLIGGNVPGIKNFGQRVVSILAAVYLLSALLMWVVPHLFVEQSFPAFVRNAVRYGLVLPLLAILVIRTGRQPAQSHYSVDLFYSVLIFLMTVVLVLGAFAIKQVSQGNYVLALAEALLVFAVFLIALSWLWDPRGGFSGIGQLLSRYFLSVGVPFERWMHSLAALADRERDADKFVILAAHELAELPWVSGVRWKASGTSGLVGEQTGHPTAFTFGGLTLTVFTRWSPGPALVLHVRLLARLLGDYYEAKVREQEQRRTAYMQAIYETGSRLTHDVKNLLQTLKSLCSAAQTSSEGDAESVRLLMQRQLPQIAQRLQITLDKLGSKPAAVSSVEDALSWWSGFKQRFAHERIAFEERGLPAGGTLPAELFESVAENLLQNALEKRKLNAELKITVTLSWSDGYLLSVHDDGDAIPESVAQQLFQSPVRSKTGLGVGLYQSARFAREQGHELRLSSNTAGNVEFQLLPS